MRLHEYQAKELLRQYTIPTPAGGTATTPEEAVRQALQLPDLPAMVKAQVHAGNRGKAGGITRAATSEEVRAQATAMLGMTLKTKQTGSAGRVVKKILVEQVQETGRELYLAILPDYATARIMILASATGGMEIEELAATDPKKISKVAVNPLAGLQPFHGRASAFALDLDPAVTGRLLELLPRLYRLFVEKDCLLLEINPLAIRTDGELIALDAKVEIDDNALFRQPEMASYRDPSGEDPLEAAAAEGHLNYIRLDGTIGMMVNGAGLAMATMDLLASIGAAPANFLDVGGGASAETVERGLRLILADPRVTAILINIFGGILHCDVLAAGVVAAASRAGKAMPMVVRLEGTNAAAGRKILADSGLRLLVAADLADAAQKMAALVR